VKEEGVRSAEWLWSLGMGGGVELWRPDVAARPEERPAWRTDCIVVVCVMVLREMWKWW
jgi:hypothetical protein